MASNEQSSSAIGFFEKLFQKRNKKTKAPSSKSDSRDNNINNTNTNSSSSSLNSLSNNELISSSKNQTNNEYGGNGDRSKTSNSQQHQQQQQQQQQHQQNPHEISIADHYKMRKMNESPSDNDTVNSQVTMPPNFLKFQSPIDPNFAMMLNNANLNQNPAHMTITDLSPIKEEHFDLALAFKLDPNMQLNMTNNNNNNNNSNFNNMNTNNRATHSATPKLDIFKEAGHTLNSVTFLTPTYCDFCSELIVGVVKQGLRCETCGKIYHKKCSTHTSLCKKKLSDLTNSSDYDFAGDQRIKSLELEHTFLRKKISINSRLMPNCDHCHGDFTDDKHFLSCKDCPLISHVKCARYAKKNCKPTAADDDDATSSGGESLPTTKNNNNNNNNKSNNSNNNASGNASGGAGGGSSSSGTMERTVEMLDGHIGKMSLDDTSVYSSGGGAGSGSENGHDSDSVASSSGKPGENPSKKFRQNPNKKSTQMLQRISQKIRKTNGVFWSGHMVYYKKDKSQLHTHYWRLDAKNICIYESYRLERLIQEIQLSSIRRASLCGLNVLNNKDENEASCLFVLSTEAENLYCGMGQSDQNSTMNLLARNFYNIFKMVYLPYSGQNASRVSLKITAPKYEEKNVHDEFKINPQELLGSGQFGQVYAGICKANNQEVAIKVIDKSRFKDFQAETSVFQNEITILYNINHQGIIKLLALFDEVETLYIITEKMATDMLEMILSRDPSRLPDRVAKFIIYQILVALNKLHDRNIAHCDLKPENILLTENIEFPQVKICDFGYAKIIGENSFRRSMVGTPAYSPPELKQKRVYNNSIDMWSMGVIVYVSLSGTFPFEENLDINEQIMNPNFMYPPDPWEQVSPKAISLINQLLQVKIDRRMSVNKALQHPWFSEDLQLYKDLMDLERKVNQKWLISKDQEEKLAKVMGNR